MQRDPDVVIAQLARALDVSMYEVGRILYHTDAIPIAAWAYDKRNNREAILLNTGYVQTLNDDELMVLIEHEVLHRAGYAEGYQFDDDELGNIALDIALQKILYLRNQELMTRVSRRVYPEESKDCAICLARCDLQRAEIPERFRPLWDDIWLNSLVPNIYDLYFAIKSDEKAVKDCAKHVGAGYPTERTPSQENNDDPSPKLPRQPRNDDENKPDDDTDQDDQETESEQGNDQSDDADQDHEDDQDSSSHLQANPDGAVDENADDESDSSSDDPLDQSSDRESDIPDDDADQDDFGEHSQLGMFSFDEDSEEIDITVEHSDVEQEPNPRDQLPDWLIVRGLPDEPQDNQIEARAEPLIDKIMQDLQKLPDNGGFSNTMSNLFGKRQIVPSKTREEGIEEYLSNVQSITEAHDALATLIQALGVDTGLSVFPGNLTSLGQMMAACGFSYDTGLWWTETPYTARPPLAIYVDTSPSMGPWAARTVAMIEQLKEYLPAQMYSFSGDVKECRTEDFARGDYYAGWSTSFDAVIQHLLTIEPETAIIFTDGESGVCSENQKRIRQSTKQIHTIFCGPQALRYGRTLAEICETCFNLKTLPKGDN